MNYSRKSDLTAERYLVTHRVDLAQQGTRLDAFLKSRYRKRSREQLKRAIDNGAVTVERLGGPHCKVGRLKPSSLLMAGDQVAVLTERKPEPEVNFNYRVLFQDPSLWVIDKPPNLPVHPAGRYFFNTLLVHLKTANDPKTQHRRGGPGGGYNKHLDSDPMFFLAHRIDKETSGILALARTREVCAHLTRQFAERTTQKHYLAIVKGVPPEEFTVDLAMKRATHSRIDLKMMIAPESQGGLPAATFFRRIGVFGDFSLLECVPKTGRQHQIRLHLDSCGHPIVGDKLYGFPEDESLLFYDRKYVSPEAEARLLLPRHALHAACLRFIHPVTNQWMEFRSDLPEDLKNFLDHARTRGSNSNGAFRATDHRPWN